jgi:hypothetical protein
LLVPQSAAAQNGRLVAKRVTSPACRPEGPRE